MVTTVLDNRSLDLTGVLDHVHRQAVLFGGPYNNQRAPIPTVNSTCRPEYLCQPGRDGDETLYHYRWAYSNVYVYADHCHSMLGHGPMPGTVEACFEPDPKGWPLFSAVTIVVAGYALVALGSLIGALLAVFKP